MSDPVLKVIEVVSRRLGRPIRPYSALAWSAFGTWAILFALVILAVMTAYDIGNDRHRVRDAGWSGLLLAIVLRWELFIAGRTK